MITQVVKLYEKQFREKLRDDWLQLIENDQSTFVIDKQRPALPLIKLTEETSVDVLLSSGVPTKLDSVPPKERNNSVFGTGEVVSNIVENIDLLRVASFPESSKMECLVNEIEKILKPRKMGLFKIQLKLMFKKNTGQNLTDMDLEMLFRENILVYNESNKLTLNS